MSKVLTRAALAVALAGLAPAAFGYSATATLTFNWGVGGTIKTWQSLGANTLTEVTNTTEFMSLSGANAARYYNPDFMPADGSGCPGGAIYQGPYVCLSTGGQLVTAPITDAGPGATAVGSITVTDTSLTGVLTVVPSSDELDPRSASGYNLRFGDGSPFGNAWFGVSSSATIELNLTGSFTPTSWQITGGTTNLRDPFFASTCVPTSNVLCTEFGAPGQYSDDGSSNGPAGWDVDGGNAGTLVEEIKVNGIPLAGMLASLAVSGSALSGQGEARSGVIGGGCQFQGVLSVLWNGSSVTCGTLIVQSVSFAASDVTVIPVPTALLLMGSAIGLLGFARRRGAPPPGLPGARLERQPRSG
jgi:hypothetical protein